MSWKDFNRRFKYINEFQIKKYNKIMEKILGSLKI